MERWPPHFLHGFYMDSRNMSKLFTSVYSGSPSNMKPNLRLLTQMVWHIVNTCQYPICSRDGRPWSMPLRFAGCRPLSGVGTRWLHPIWARKSAGPLVEGIKKWNFRDMPLMKNAENHRNWTFIGFIIKYSIRISNGQPANPKYHRNSYWFYRDQILSANNIGGQEHLQDVASVPNLLRNSGLKKLFISWIGSTVGHGHRKQKTCGCWWKWQWNLSYEYNLLFLILPYTPAFVA